MGKVFKAWDPDLERFVALKYLRDDDPVLVERLLHEARAQARVDHPAVCRVYEVGTDEGQPFIVMQFVEGRQLGELATELSLEQKVLVVQQVAEAVQAAHAVGLIHRDLKPANILIAKGDDGALQPYVLDFGIAREQEVAGLTATGQVVGTPGYLSPEQARGETSTIDRRTDVFSLGVILYELLTGARPFRGNSQVEILLALLQHDPVLIRELAEEVPCDLETVVMRCLEKDRDRRYPSARALADDLGRFLAGEPVEARAVGRTERLVRRARRHPVATGALLVAAAATVGLVAVAVGGWIKYTVDLTRERNVAVEARSEAESRKAQAEAREEEAREIAEFLVSVFEVTDPNESHGEELTAREVLDRGAGRIQRQLDRQPLTQARLLGVMGEVYSRLGLYDDARPLLEQSLDLVLGQPERELEAEAQARVRLADLCVNVSDLDRAAEIVASVPAMVAGAPDLDPRDAAQALGCVARVQLYRGEMAESEQSLHEAIRIAEAALGPDAALVGDLLNDGLDISKRRKFWDQAIADGVRALEIRELHYGEDDPRVGTTLNNLILAYEGAGDLETAAAMGERALDIRTRVLGADHPRTSTTLNNLGMVYKKMGRLDQAEELYLRALEIRIAALGPDHPRIANVYNNLARVYSARGDLDQAESMFRRALAINEAGRGPDHPEVGIVLSNLATVLRDTGRFDAAEPLYLRSLRIREATYGTDSGNLVGTLHDLGESYRRQGRTADAIASFARARRIAATAFGEDSSWVGRLDSLLTTSDPA
jgi:serine/threonine-protein kinase